LRRSPVCGVDGKEKMGKKGSATRAPITVSLQHVQWEGGTKWRFEKWVQEVCADPGGRDASDTGAVKNRTLNVCAETLPSRESGTKRKGVSKTGTLGKGDVKTYSVGSPSEKTPAAQWPKKSKTRKI